VNLRNSNGPPEKLGPIAFANGVEVLLHHRDEHPLSARTKSMDAACGQLSTTMYMIP